MLKNWNLKRADRSRPGEIIEAKVRLKKVDVDKISADMKQRFPNMDDYDREHAEAAVVVWKQRLAQVDADEIAWRLIR